MHFDDVGHSGVPELIDTLWNVNHHFIALVYSCENRINRYIMECK